MMESKDRAKYLVEKKQIESVITEALLIEKKECGDSLYTKLHNMTEILAAEVVKLECWGMFFLLPEDIEQVGHKMGVVLTSEQVSEVRRLFRKAFEVNNDNWRDMLDDAIEEALDDGNM